MLRTSNNPSKTANIKNGQPAILDLYAHLMTIAARYRNRILGKSATHSAIHALLKFSAMRTIIIEGATACLRTISASNMCMAECIAALLSILFRYLTAIVIR